MSKLFKVLCLVVASAFLLNGTSYADISITVPIDISVVIGAETDISVQVRNISDDVVAGAISFTDPLSAQWTIANQYLKVIYTCNLPLYAVRIISDNKDVAYYPDMYGAPISAGPNGLWDGPPEANPASDDIVTYAGLIDPATDTNPDNRARLGWQVYADPLGLGVFPAAVTDASYNGIEGEAGNWNAPWAAIADKSDTAFVDAADSDGDVDTIDYDKIALGGAAASGLNYHPAEYIGGVLQPKPGDGDVSVYLAGRFEGLSAGTYGTNLLVELVYPE